MTATMRTAVLLAFWTMVLPASSDAQTHIVTGQTGLLAEWDVNATVTQRSEDGEWTGPLSLKHVGFCSVDGPEEKTGEFETLQADSVVLALGQDVDLSLLQGVPGLEVKNGVVQVGPNMMTGVACPGQPAAPMMLLFQ